MVEFAELTKEESTHLDKIIERVKIMVESGRCRYDLLDLRMDLTATHFHNPIDFERLSKADDFNFSHDVFGIRSYLDRRTGKLTDFFLPRFTRRES